MCIRDSAIWSFFTGTGAGDSFLAYLAAFLPMALNVSKSISGAWENSSKLLNGNKSFWCITLVPLDCIPIPTVSYTHLDVYKRQGRNR